VRSLRYFLAGLILLLGISFACLNAELVNINLYFQIYQLPLSLLLILVLGLGMLVGLLGICAKNFQLRIKNTHLKNQLKSLEQEVSHLRMMPLKNND
jgi:putative membrane protein